MSDTLATALERADLRDILSDLYPDAGVNPMLDRQRISAPWRGGDNREVVSLTPGRAHDFKTGETWSVWTFLTEVAGFSKADAAAYLLERVGLADTLPVRREAARRERVATAQQRSREAYLRHKLDEAHQQQRHGPTTGSSGYFARKGVSTVLETHEVTGGAGPDSSELPGLTYGQDKHGPFVQLALRLTDATATGYQRLYDGKVLPGDRDKDFIGSTKGSFILLVPRGVQLPRTPERMAALLEAGFEVAVCEGVATGASIALARPRALVFCALSAGNLEPVVAALRERYGRTRRLGKRRKAIDICIWADADLLGQEKAHAAALDFGCYVRTPSFRVQGSGSDFNDLHAAHGLGAVRRTPKTTPDVRLAFAKELGKQHLSDVKHLPPFDLPAYNEALIVRAPMESGKTHQLERVVAETLAAGLRVLVVVHRESLADSLAARLKLEVYTDYTAPDLRYVNRGLVICFDSLWKLGLGGQLPGYDLLVLDECEQVLRHVTADHISNKAASFAALTHYLAHAPRFIGLDAHAGALTRRTLERFAPQKRVRTLRHDHHVGAGRTVRLVCDRDDALDALLEGDRPTWYATDSLRHTRDLMSYLDDSATLTINSETGGSDAVRAYFGDPTGTAPRYDRLIASPSVQTGLSDDSHRWQHVVGSFSGAIGTPQDALQSLLRARGAPQLTVYTKPVRRPVKTQADFMREIKAADREEDRLRGTQGAATDPAYVDFKSGVLEHESRARSNFKGTLTRELTLMGYDVAVDLPHDLTATELERRRERKDALHESGLARYVADRVAAPRIGLEKAVELRRRSRLTQAERFALDQFKVRSFYALPDDVPDPVLAEMLHRDEYGKLREQVRRYEGFIEPEAVTRARAAQQEEDGVPLSGDRRHPMLRREFYRRLGEVVGLTPETEGVGLDEWEARRAELAAEVAGLETEREGATTRRKGELDRRIQHLRRTLNDHEAALSPTTYAAGDDRVKAFTAWVLEHQDALTHLGIVQRGATIDPGYIVARIGGWLRGAGLKQRRGRGRGATYAVTRLSVSTMRGYSRPRRTNWQSSHFLEFKSLDMKKVLQTLETTCSTTLTSSPPNPNPALVIAELFETGKLDDFGPQKLRKIRSKLAERDEKWLNILANSRYLRVLGAKM